MIRKLTEKDIDKLFILEKNCFFDYWSKNMLQDELKKETSYLYGMFEDDNLFGYILLSKCVDEVEILKICVDVEQRKKGIGKRLIEFSLEDIGKISSVYLEVRKSNTGAIKLYEKCGFEKIGERKKYYKDNEDAVLMVKSL
ncbi:MAG: ribosomal-protein-alanine N-acetyltransferase [Ruminococcaceae bacterium]|nr:ribosomal-protein-alanine N-acetyltransferase [Oscillospiraceae bacterium]